MLGSKQPFPDWWLVYRRPPDSRDPHSRMWVPVDRHDNARLTTARGAAESNSRVLIEGDLYEILLPSRAFRAMYWCEPEGRAVHASWCYRTLDKSGVVPLSEEDADILSAKYHSLERCGETTSLEFELSDQSGVAHLCATVTRPKSRQPSTEEAVTTNDAVTEAANRPPSPEATLKRQIDCFITFNEGSARVPLLRGIPADVIGADLERRATVMDQLRGFPFRWVVFITHGIGEALTNRELDRGSGALRFRTNVCIFRNKLNESLVEAGCKFRVAVLPLEWVCDVHNLNTDRSINTIMLPSLQSVRDFCNFALTDIFLYIQPATQEAVWRNIVSQLNDNLGEFKKNHPDFAENLKQSRAFIGCVGHSLGGVILNDVLAHAGKRVPERFMDGSAVSAFQLPALNDGMPKLFITLGSPLGLFSVIRESGGFNANSPLISPSPVVVDSARPHARKSDLDLGFTRVNIFHPYDFIAGRLEPLFRPGSYPKNPGVIPHAGGLRLHLSIGELSSQLGKRLSYLQSLATGILTAGFSSTVSTVTYGQKTKDELDEEAHADAIKALNSDLRIDWCLQESPADIASEWLAATRSHFVYWAHEDVADFIVSLFGKILSDCTVDADVPSLPTKNQFI